MSLPDPRKDRLPIFRLARGGHDALPTCWSFAWLIVSQLRDELAWRADGLGGISASYGT